MNPRTTEWVRKAEGDYRAARKLSRASGLHDQVCFHAQQCAEKYLKAALCQSGMTIDRTHDLSALLNQLLSVDPMLVALRLAADSLTDYAVRFRYPDDSADKTMAERAIEACGLIRKRLREHLGCNSARRKKKRQ